MLAIGNSVISNVDRENWPKFLLLVCNSVVTPDPMVWYTISLINKWYGKKYGKRCGALVVPYTLIYE
jgi:hypothetical protein